MQSAILYDNSLPGKLFKHVTNHKRGDDGGIEFAVLIFNISRCAACQCGAGVHGVSLVSDKWGWSSRSAACFRHVEQQFTECRLFQTCGAAVHGVSLVSDMWGSSSRSVACFRHVGQQLTERRLFQTCGAAVDGTPLVSDMWGSS